MSDGCSSRLGDDDVSIRGNMSRGFGGKGAKPKPGEMHKKRRTRSRNLFMSLFEVQQIKSASIIQEERHAHRPLKESFSVQ